MKKNLLFALIALLFIGFYSCDDDEVTPEVKTKSETVSMGADYVNDVYYSLSNGIVAEVPRKNWDIAFSVGAMSSSILINDGAGVELKVYPTDAGWQWANSIDTAGYHEWELLYNSNESWEEAAFGQNATGHPNYGWGEYNETTHNVEGVAMYIIKLPNDEYKRIFIELKGAMTQQYSFKYSDLDGSNEVSETINFAGNTANYIYYSITDEAVVADREPDASTWDLLFTKYIDTSIPYNVTGIKQNIGVEVIDEDNVLDLTIETYLASEFDDNMTEIGSDWKDFDMGSFQYVVDSDRMYFVKGKDEKNYKIVFTGVEGSSTGNFMFDITSL